MSKPSLQSVVRCGWEVLLSRGKQRPAVHRWYHAMQACRTPRLGGHRWVCPEGCVEQVVFNSCKHRACPQCGGLETERWVRKVQSQQLLDCDYYHVIFTVPHELNPWWRWNRAWFGNQLLGAARETLLVLLADPKWLGAVPGLLLNLQTWTRTMADHPHGHVLVTGGGWTRDGWRTPKKDILLPGKAVRKMFRGKLRARLRAGILSGEMVLPEGQRANQALSLLNKLGRPTIKEWSVRVQPPYRHGRGVLRYLSRYVRRGPFSPSQLLSFDGTWVRFLYLDHDDGRLKPMSLEVGDFVDRLTQHVPEPGFHMIRHAGLWAPGKKAELAQCRAWLGMAPAGEEEVLSVVAYLEEVGQKTLTECPECGATMKMVGKVEPSGLSPPEGERRAA